MDDLRPSPIAGRWYPGEANALRRSVDAFLESAPPPGDVPPERVVGLLAPHAGHVYSGPVAAYAFRSVSGAKVEVVALVCPSHFHADGPALTTGHDAYATPLGVVAVDRGAIEQVRAELGASLGRPPERALVEIRNDQEHAIEIELPFLQRALAAEFQLLPIMLRDQGDEMALALGEALARSLAGRRALLVASSDLSHYFPQPRAEQLDAEMLRLVEAFDPSGVLAAQAAGRGQACGPGAIAAVLWAARALGATRARVVRHATSGDVSGDFDQVVGYGAAVLWKN
jgi:AmmeMemoRadiSam system protein B